MTRDASGWRLLACTHVRHCRRGEIPIKGKCLCLITNVCGGMMEFRAGTAVTDERRANLSRIMLVERNVARHLNLGLNGFCQLNFS
jgi:hypothetical protein